MNTTKKISRYLSYLFSPTRKLFSMRDEIRVLEESIQNHSLNLSFMKSTTKFLSILLLCTSMLIFSKNMNAQCDTTLYLAEDDSCSANDLAIYVMGNSYSGKSFLWNNGSTNRGSGNVSSGSYSVIVYDSSRMCYDTLGINVVDDTCNSNPCAYFQGYINYIDSCGSNDIYIYTDASGGSNSNSYVWNTGATAAYLYGKTTGTYTVTITDNVYGCKDTVSINVVDSSGNCCQYFNGQIYETDSCKMNDVKLSAYGSGGSYSYSYLWNTGATTSSISNKTTGGYSVTITDNAYGCKDTVYYTVSDDTCDICSYFRNSNYIGFYDNCQANDVVIYSKTQDSSSTNLTFLWNTGATTANLNGKTTGTYTVTITQVSTGCKDTISVYAHDSVYKCCSANFWIQGDSSGSGSANATKTIYSYSYSQNGNITNYSWNYGDGTNGSGQNVTKTYSTAGNYTICHFIQDATGCKDTMCKTVIAPPPGKNLKVSHYGSPYIVSNRYKWTYIVYQNLGTTSENAVVEYRMPAGMSVNYNYPSVTSTSGNKLTFNLGTLAPGAYGYIWLGLNVPSTYSTGSSKCDTAIIMTNTNDIDSSNNISYRCDSVVSSYDPNEKVATPKGVGAEGRIDPATKEIGYLIHFQNEGSYKTFNVRVEDEIDPSFDINSLLVGDASYGYRMVRNGRKIVWYFDGLELAPKSQDEQKSQGFVQYTLKINPGMPLGTQLKNTAYIYFDYNDAIVTNTTVNTLKNADANGGGSAIRNANNDNLDFEATKSNEKIIIVAKEKIDAVQIFDISGKSLFSKQLNTKQTELNFESAANAVYIIQVQVGDNTIVKKYSFK